MALYIAYAWLQVSQLGSATATYDIYDSDNYPMVCLPPPQLHIQPPPLLIPGPPRSTFTSLWPPAMAHFAAHHLSTSWLHLASWCQENAKDIAERCIAFICHAALGIHCVRQVLLASTPSCLCHAFRSTSNIVLDTALASAESPLCKAGVRTCRRAIH